MRGMVRTLAVVVVFALCSASGMAEEAQTLLKPDVRRLCTPQDLVGTYMLVDFSERPPSRESQSNRMFPYKYLTFRPPTSYASIRVRKALHSAAEADAALSHLSQSYYTYSLKEGGALYLYTGKKISYSYRCIASLVSADSYQKGDLILTAYMQKGKTVLRELYRRWY